RAAAARYWLPLAGRHKYHRDGACAAAAGALGAVARAGGGGVRLRRAWLAAAAAKCGTGAALRPDAAGADRGDPVELAKGRRAVRPRAGRQHRAKAAPRRPDPARLADAGPLEGTDRGRGWPRRADAGQPA